MRDDAERLRGIRACDKIEEYIDGMSFEDFVDDEKTIDACATKSSVIGNFCKEISDRLKDENPDVNWEGAYRFRCRVDHSYDTPSFDLSIMWDTLMGSIPRLRDDCARILEEQERTSESTRSKDVPRKPVRRKLFHR